MRAGDWEHFRALFDPMPAPSGGFVWSDAEKPKRIKGDFWWSVLQGTDGRLYAAPGYHFIDRVGWVRTRKSWASSEYRRYECIKESPVS